MITEKKNRKEYLQRKERVQRVLEENICFRKEINNLLTQIKIDLHEINNKIVGRSHDHITRQCYHVGVQVLILIFTLGTGRGLGVWRALRIGRARWHGGRVATQLLQQRGLQRRPPARQ